MRRVRVVIRGDVQNVGFRSWTKHKADMLGVRGWVKNDPRGAVEAVFESEEGKVKEIIDECRRGPPGSYVEDVDIIEENPKGNLEGFRVVI